MTLRVPSLHAELVLARQAAMASWDEAMAARFDTLAGHLSATAVAAIAAPGTSGGVAQRLSELRHELQQVGLGTSYNGLEIAHNACRVYFAKLGADLLASNAVEAQTTQAAEPEERSSG